jgi:hypothetical protein
VRVSGVALATVLASAVAGAGFALWPAVQQRLPEPAGVTLGGRVPTAGLALSTWLGRRAELEANSDVQVRHPDGVLVVPRRALGVSLDTATAQIELVRPRAPSSLFTRLRVALGGVPPEPVEVRLAICSTPVAQRRGWQTSRLGYAASRSTRVGSGRARTDRGSVGARAGSGSFAVAHRRARPSRRADVGVHGAGPEVATGTLVNVDPSVVLSEYETDFAKRGGPRVKNIARAARYLDGTVMAPARFGASITRSARARWSAASSTHR